MMRKPTQEQFDRDQMPWFLKKLALLCFFGVVFLVAAVIPFGQHTIGNESVSYAEFWRYGGGPVFIFNGLILPFVGYAFVRSKPWGRHLLAAYFVLLNVFGIVAAQFVQIYANAVDHIFYWGILTALLIWYLYFKKNVRGYFARIERMSNKSFERASQ